VVSGGTRVWHVAPKLLSHPVSPRPCQLPPACWVRTHCLRSSSRRMSSLSSKTSFGVNLVVVEDGSRRVCNADVSWVLGGDRFLMSIPGVISSQPLQFDTTGHCTMALGPGCTYILTRTSVADAIAPAGGSQGTHGALLLSIGCCCVVHSFFCVLMRGRPERSCRLGQCSLHLCARAEADRFRQGRLATANEG